MGKCVFNRNWLSDPRFSAWAREFKGDEHTANCIVCNKLVDLGKMGEHALLSHMNSKKHKSLVTSTVSMSSPRLTDFFKETGAKKKSEESEERKKDFTIPPPPDNVRPCGSGGVTKVDNGIAAEAALRKAVTDCQGSGGISEKQIMDFRMDARDFLVETCKKIFTEVSSHPFSYVCMNPERDWGWGETRDGESVGMERDWGWRETRDGEKPETERDKDGERSGMERLEMRRDWAKTCRFLTSPDDGQLSSYDFSFPNTISVLCNVGYSLKGYPDLTCQANGEWDGTMPSCQVNECPPLWKPNHGEMTQENLRGKLNIYRSKVTFTCDYGYRPQGEVIRTCLANKTWSGENHVCEHAIRTPRSLAVVRQLHVERMRPGNQQICIAMRQREEGQQQLQRGQARVQQAGRKRKRRMRRPKIHEVCHSIHDGPWGKGLLSPEGTLRYCPQSTTDASTFPLGPSRSDGVSHISHVLIKV
ncbi:hypothetical protein ScPMuIL_011129 [Solemya velum]